MSNKEKEHKLVIRHVFDKLIGEGDLTTYDDLVAEDVVGHCPASWQKFHAVNVHGRSNIKPIDIEYRNSLLFKDVAISEMISVENKVFVRWSSNGLHRGSFFGFEATHRTFSITGQTLYSFNSDVQIVEVWQCWDMHGLLNQIGWEASPNNIKLAEFNQLSKKASKLSEREKSCLRHLVHGKTARETAACMFVSPRTIEHYFENIKNKLNVSSKRELFPIVRALEANSLL